MIFICTQRVVRFQETNITQSAGAVEYIDFFFAEG